MEYITEYKKTSLDLLIEQLRISLNQIEQTNKENIIEKIENQMQINFNN